MQLLSEHPNVITTFYTKVSYVGHSLGSFTWLQYISITELVGYSFLILTKLGISLNYWVLNNFWV